MNFWWRNIFEFKVCIGIVWKQIECFQFKKFFNYEGIIEIYNLGNRVAAILKILNSEQLTAYRNAIITKKLSSIAFYQHGLDWDAYMDGAQSDFIGTAAALFAK